MMEGSRNSGDEHTAQQPQPNPDLRSLGRLIGTWKVSGEASGTVTYEWVEGGFFLLQARRARGGRGDLR